MKLVTRVKLQPTPEQASALRAPLHACNAAADHASRIAHTTGVTDNRRPRALTCTTLKAHFALGAQAAQHAIKQTSDACTARAGRLTAGTPGTPGSTRRRRATGKPVTFRPDAAQPYDTACSPAASLSTLT
ncbi:hypothetical protein [Streptomyces thermodiastaticus]|uniref:hypothetical protein n=1 Tax=Streptomyces thermodiastaticus TaxID=44061 RepID=UPI0016756666|nr:hypothetical protein [Streptomyces thermodiastaticus]MCE7550582.1 hypothetical protein [Streptomyces thermodiastaticus]GHF95266.1 hypothetical protein GCM10018787_49980 [Streptomyces thermodiastaticus]